MYSSVQLHEVAIKVRELVIKAFNDGKTNSEIRQINLDAVIADTINPNEIHYRVGGEFKTSAEIDEILSKFINV